MQVETSRTQITTQKYMNGKQHHARQDNTSSRDDLTHKFKTLSSACTHHGRQLHTHVNNETTCDGCGCAMPRTRIIKHPIAPRCERRANYLSCMEVHESAYAHAYTRTANGVIDFDGAIKMG